MPRECVLCTEVDSEEQPLLELPCFRHWICRDCLPDYFVNATNNESLYPPNCCEEPVSLDKFANYLPEDVKHAYLVKEQGEYTILPKYRVYCANPSCGKFLHPSEHIKDDSSNNIYAVCDGNDCFRATCCACKTLLIGSAQEHVCQVQEHDQKFKETVEENGYKECFTCGATVELAEACNHITCGCGTEFCYICGKEWLGVHSCPHYGPAMYDDEGYNQNGFHRESGLNREGRTHRQELIHQHAQNTHNTDDDVDNDNADNNPEDEDQEERDPDVEAVWQQLTNRLDPDQRAILEHLDPETREEALMQIMDEWLAQGIIFDELHPAAQPQPEGDGDGDGDGNDQGTVLQETGGVDEDNDGNEDEEEDEPEDIDNDGPEDEGDDGDFQSPDHEGEALNRGEDAQDVDGGDTDMPHRVYGASDSDLEADEGDLSHQRSEEVENEEHIQLQSETDANLESTYAVQEVIDPGNTTESATI